METFSGPTCPRSQMFETYVGVTNGVPAFKVKENFTYLDAVISRFLHIETVRKLSSIDVEEPEMDIAILDTLAETRERIFKEEEETTHDIIGSNNN